MIISNQSNYAPTVSYNAQKHRSLESAFNEALKEAQAWASAGGASAAATNESQNRPAPARIAPPGLVLATLEQRAAFKAHYEGIAAAEAAKKNIPEPNTSLRWFEDSRVVFSQMPSIADGKIVITIGKNQLPLLIDEIEKALAEGKSYTTAIQKLYDSHNHERGKRAYDSFFLDPVSGQITHAMPLGFSVGEDGYCHSQRDDDAAWDLAYDLQQFLKLRVFGEADGMDEKEIEDKIADIKERQENKCTWRFDSRPLAIS